MMTYICLWQTHSSNMLITVNKKKNFLKKKSLFVLMIMVIINLCLNFDDNIILNLFINIFSTSFPSQHVRILSYRPSSLIFHTMDIGHTHTRSLCYCQSFSQHDHRSNYHLHHCILDISCWSRVLNAWATRFWVSIYLSIHIATHFWKIKARKVMHIQY